MRKVLLLAVLFVACALTANAQLLSITRDANGTIEHGDIIYDGMGRVSEYRVTESGTTKIFHCIYSGDVINVSVEECADTYTYTLVDGKVVSAIISLENNDFKLKNTIEYDGDMIKTQNHVFLFSNGSEETIRYIYGWSRGDINSMEVNYEGNPFMCFSYDYGEITSQPIVRALFGFSGEPDGHLSECIDILALYSHIGNLPYHLPIHVSKSEYQDIISYDYTYETDALDRVTKVILKSKDSTTVYTLEWENETSLKPVHTGVRSDKLFNLKGQKVYFGSASSDHLPHGIYVKDGRKVIK